LSKDPESLIAALGSADSRERENAANALIAVADRRAEEPLLEALADPDAGVRARPRSRLARSARGGPCRVCSS
jgi:hypothetical protein